MYCIVIAESTLTFGALPRRAIGFLEFNTLLAIFAQTTRLAPLVWWKMLLELDVSETSALSIRHVFVLDSLPINILAT